MSCVPVEGVRVQCLLWDSGQDTAGGVAAHPLNVPALSIVLMCAVARREGNLPGGVRVVVTSS